MQSNDESSDEGQKHKVEKYYISLATSCFRMACNVEGIMAMISRLMTQEWQDGLA
jgi:hypothetical protein